VVSNQYSGVVFSSDGGPSVLMAVQDLLDQNSQPNVLCATSAPGCNNDVILTFSTPINSISFDAYENQTPLIQAFATAAIFQNNSATSSLTVNLLVVHTTHCGAPSSDCASDPQTISFANMTKIVITPTASEGANGGTFYDNFSFTQADVVAPEPSTLLLTGLCGIAWLGELRRRNSCGRVE
jgi:hypothetical protein